MAAYGATGIGLQGIGQQRQLTQADVQEVVRQLVTVIPQVIGSLQTIGQAQRF